jgi:hypothetical protein
VEAAVEFIGRCPPGGVEIADGRICRSAAQTHLPAPDGERVHEARPWSDPPCFVGLDGEVPAVGAELEAVVPDVADLGTTAHVITG